jgi:23S rRNA (guanine2445-N2)-methyltransferase / 23S rRNA (guanine2069-N7)-methyltransferase
MPTFFATCARGVEPVLAAELRALRAADVREARAGVSFTGSLQTAYAACLWSRTASRVLFALGSAPATTVDSLYEGVRAIPWEDHLSPDGTLAVDFATDPNPAFRNTMFGAQKVKDAIVDRLRDRFGRRPSVDAVAPDVRINVRVRSGKATVSLDLSGDALHRRGYREPGVQGAAPLKESLAAAVLLLAGWREIARGGGALVDPMCGSGTLLVEGAWIAGDVAPGLLRSHWGFDGWLRHDATAWDELLAAADDRAEAGLANLPPIHGADSDASAVALASATIARAGLRGRVTVEIGDVAAACPPSEALGGLVAVNPPYGERLGEAREALAVYGALGRRLLEAFPGWSYAVLAGDDEHAAAVGLIPHATHRLFNGTIPVRLDTGAVPSAAAPDVTGGVTAFANRLHKNRKRLGKWARREGVTCWRAYDADLPDFNVAVDIYDCDDGVRRVVVSEYEAPAEIDAVKAGVRLDRAVDAVAEVLETRPSEVRVKVRRRQRGSDQYEQLAETGRFHVVEEGGARLLVNLDDYLDTGLFLDHRLTRGMVARLVSGGRLLNLFAYTGAATVRAVVAGAVESVSVDLSNTYCQWARRNLDLAGADPARHAVVREDVRRYLEAPPDVGAPRFDVVFCDPPSFSTSKSMEGTLDVQRDHVALVSGCAGHLADGGTIVFSTNLRTFRVDAEGLAGVGLTVEDVTAATIPPDFERNPRIHRCFLVRRA